MITAVFFDIGGVLLRTQTLEPRRAWERKFGLKDWELQHLFFNSDVGLAAQIGQVTTEDAWAYVAQTLGASDEDIAGMRRDFFAGDVLDRDLIGLIQSLRPRYKTGVISNAMPDARESLSDRINGDTFDQLVFSAEEGVKKPDPVIYQRALERMGVVPEQSIFVDDMLLNVEGARAVGMCAIQYVEGLNVKKVFAELGIR